MFYPYNVMGAQAPQRCYVWPLAGNQSRECSKRQMVSCVLPAITLGRQQLIGVSPEGPYFQDKRGGPAERVLRVRFDRVLLGTDRVRGKAGV